MNIGDGLTLQSQSVDGKTTAGIFILPGNFTKTKNAATKNARDKNKFSLKTKKIKSSKETNVDLKSKKFVQPANSKQVKAKKEDLTENDSTSTDVVFIDNNTKVNDAAQNAKHASGRKTNDLPNGKVNKTVSKKSVSTSNVRVKQANQASKPTTELKVDTNFVTLTQDQLNTILNLVKTKQEIDLAAVINKDNKNATEQEKKPSSSESKHVEPTSVPGLDLDRSESPDENKNDSDKENKSGENVEKLLEKATGEPDSRTNKSRNSSSKFNKGDADITEIDKKTEKKNNTIAELSGTLGGFGSRDRERSRLEERRKKWIQDLNEQVERKKQLQVSRKIASMQEIKSSSTEQIPSSTSLSGPVSNEKEHRSAPSSSDQTRTAETDHTQSSTGVDLIHQSLPTAMRSSFFLGEAAPREHAFSAKKRQEQEAWRNELEQQIKEKNAQKHQTPKEKFVSDDMWSRHFDTMNPVPSKLDRESVASPAITSARVPQDNVEVQNQPKESPRNSALNSDNIAGIYLGEHTTSSNSIKSPNNYLRTMTSLLDPSQIEANELKRRKQLEHRRIIAEQVEEKRRLKEKDRKAKKKEEELEERRLMEERMQLKNQFEREKNKQQKIEEERDRQTQDLYQQMKEAEAAALKEKFERRQQNLRNHGHDTSRLERTHQHALEKSMHSIHHSPPPPHHDHHPPHHDHVPPHRDHVPAHRDHVPPLGLQDVHPNHYTDSPRSHPVYQTDNSSLTVATSSSQVPIKLEISLNQNQAGSYQIAKAVQTDDFGLAKKRRNKKNDTLLEILSDSDADTQYMDLPYPSGRKKETKRKPNETNRGREGRNRNYDQYARTTLAEKDADRTRQTKRSKGFKPKWGVGEKKKNYVPNSNRYVSRQEKEEREMRLRQREEELLADQARNHPDRLIPTRKVKSDMDVLEGAGYTLNAPDNRRPRQTEKYRSPPGGASVPSKSHRIRSNSPPVPAVRNQLREERSFETVPHRSDTAISVTTDNAKYESSKHTSNSPVPLTDDFVQYRRSDVVLDPNQPQSRPTTEKEDSVYVFERNYGNGKYSPNIGHSEMQAGRNKDPLFNADVMKQKDRQDKILKEISILRQGLLLKQREVASYPVAVTVPHGGRNLPERTNDVTLT